MKVSLKTLGQIVTGNTPSKSNPEYWHSDDISFVKPDILPDNKVADVWKTKECISEAARSKSRIVGENAIFVTCIGSIGKIGIATKGEFALNQQINAIIPNSKVFPKYLAYVLLNAKPRLTVMANAPVVPIINKSQFGDFQIDISENYEEQKRISAILDSIESIITQQNQALYLLDKLVKSRFVEMFGDPEDSTAKWNRTNFASVCLDMHQGINTVADKIEYVDSGFPILQSKNITSGFLNLEDVRYVKESDYEYYRNKYNPQPNDLLVCNIGTIGKSLIVENEMEFLIAWNLFLIKLNKELVNPIFIKVFIELLNQQNYFEKYMTGGTVKFVNKKTIGNISTPLPPLELQEQFSAFVAEVDKSKLAVKQSLEKLETLKKSLMQQYFG